eukprot:CAMPEP_0115367670 /NCGR_PEP_ID=MMETSP0270-20121206/105431_1 /TAXON_ID=71861 /ORGANISM="Scrippsiella trochoidea, Strain CCMP3099" /LENGTH=496 /DNA_ID=CAMNT_0002790461 /DNA_START=27 /DNA_END=1517 /DNA_ORIENTATION=+
MSTRTMWPVLQQSTTLFGCRALQAPQGAQGQKEPASSGGKSTVLEGGLPTMSTIAETTASSDHLPRPGRDRRATPSRAATLRVLLRQAREELSEPLAGPVDVPADTNTDLGVAFLAPPGETQEFVNDLVSTEDLRDFINSGEFERPDLEAPAIWSEDEQEAEPSSMSTSEVSASGASQCSVDLPATAAWLGGLQTGASSSSLVRAGEAEAVTSTAGAVPASSSSVQSTGPSLDVVDQPKPWLVFNKHGEPCAHWERSSPPLATSLAKFDKYRYACQVPRRPFVIADFVEFLREYSCADNLLAPTQEPLLWGSDNAEAAGMGVRMHSAGCWYRFGFREPQPEPLAGTDTRDPQVWRHSWAAYSRCLHSTNLYVLPKLLREKLTPGPRPGRGGKPGVYCFPMSRVRWSVLSSGYCVYAPPRRDGWFIGPRIEMQVAMGLSHQQRIAVGAHQYAAWLGCYSATALWIHVIHEDDLRAAWSQSVGLYYSADTWRPELVVP